MSFIVLNRLANAKLKAVESCTVTVAQIIRCLFIIKLTFKIIRSAEDISKEIYMKWIQEYYNKQLWVQQ